MYQTHSIVLLNFAEIPRKPQEDAYRQACMKMLVHFNESFCFAEYSGVVKCDAKDEALNACTWTNVECEGSTVVKIDWYERQGSNDSIDIQCIPPRVRNVAIRYAEVSSRFFAAALPRELLTLSLVSIGLSGSVDIYALPRKLTAVSLKDNRLQGTVVLKDLPPNMQLLYLQDNIFKCVIVENSALPDSLELVQLGGSNKRMRVRSLDGKLSSQILIKRGG